MAAWEKAQTTKAEVSPLYLELQLCWGRGWSYERDWLTMSRWERAHWLAFVSIEAWRLDDERSTKDLAGRVASGR